MLYVDDSAFDGAYFTRTYALLDRHPILGRASRTRIAACVSDTAFSIALCLYVKARGGSLFPLPMGTPIDAARRRAERSGCEYLLFGGEAQDALRTIERVEPSVARESAATPALIQMSSGTTGEPKYIARSWSDIDLEVESYIAHFEAANAMTPVVACPVNHSYGLISGVLVAMARGVAPVVISNLNPKYILRKLAQARSSLLYASPTLIATITMLADEDAPLDAVMTSGTLMQKRWFEGARNKVRHLHQQYGCSEAGCVTLGLDIEAPNELGAPLPHVTLVAGEGVNAPSEIVVTLQSGARIATRDLGYMANEKLHFASRLDDMINVSGLNVYPSEVEEVVLSMPTVTDAVVYRQTNAFGNDQVSLVFVASAPIAHQSVRAWCTTKLASHQVPMNITQMPSIPKLPNGKVSRKALSEDAGKRDAQVGTSRETLS